MVIIMKSLISLHLNPNTHSYTYPIIKIIGCLFIGYCLWNRKRLLWRIYDSDYVVLGSLVEIMAICLVVFIVFCFFLSITEVIKLHDERKFNEMSASIKRTGGKSKAKEYCMDDIIGLVKKNAIIEIAIVFNQSVVNVGSSSVWDSSDSYPHDKSYFIDNEFFDSLDDFRTELTQYATNGKVSVLSIDHSFV